VHARDAARAIELVLNSSPALVGGRVFNVGATDQNFQKQQLVEMIRPHAPDAVIEFVFKAEDPRDYLVSFARITDQLGFKISRTVAEGIAEIAHLVRENVVDNFADQKYRN
jgi:nucleoside-diphosphate-sugar epimerase